MSNPFRTGTTLRGSRVPALFGAGAGAVESFTDPTNSDVSTEDTVRDMVSAARIYAAHPQVRGATAQALAHLPPNASTEERAKGLFWFVKRKIRFTSDQGLLANAFGLDHLDKELLISPDTLLSMRTPMGDCDDYSLLLASMLLSAGLPASYVTVAANGKEPHVYSHVYTKTYVPGRGDYCLDASHGPFPGWEHNEVYRKTVWPVAGGDMVYDSEASMNWCGHGTCAGCAGCSLKDSCPSAGLGCQYGLGIVPVESAFGTSWGDIFKAGTAQGFNILESLVDPRYRQGTFVQQTPEGGLTIQRAQAGPSVGISTFPSTEFSPAGGDIMKWGLVAVAALGGLMIVSRMAK